MPAPQPVFRPCYDIHLLREQSIRIDTLLEIEGRDATEYVKDSAHSNLKFDFATLSNKFELNMATATYEGFGVKIKLGNEARTPKCTVEALANEPANPDQKLRNFILLATVTDTTDADAATNTRTTFIRIHIHKTIHEIWITPNPLTVYQGDTWFLPSVYARYDDDVVAEMQPVFAGAVGGALDYSFTPEVKMDWSSATTGLISTVTSEDVNFEAIMPGNRSGSHPIKMRATFKAKHWDAEGQVNISTIFNQTQTEIRAELVSTGNCPGFSAAADVPNILFLPDGFIDEDRNAWDMLVDNYVDDLCSARISSPFNWLSGKINFWKAFVPSRERGGSHRSEFFITEDQFTEGTIPVTKVTGHFMPTPNKPAGTDVDAWDLDNLVYAVGSPVESHASLSDDQIKSFWLATTNLSPEDFQKLLDKPDNDIYNPNLIKAWKKLVHRRLMGEKDTAFGLCVNDHRYTYTDPDKDKIEFNLKRINRAFLDKFFKGLTTADPAENIGKNFVMSPLTDRGKDYDMVVFVSAAIHSRELNGDGYMFITLQPPKDAIIRGAIITDYNISFDRNEIQNFLAPYKKATLTHELGHSFGLGDEYGEPPPETDFPDKPITDPKVASWVFASYKDSAADLDIYANLQARQDLLKPDPNTPGQFIPDAFKLKWRYHRIKICGRVSSLTFSPTQIEVGLKEAVKNFKIHDKIFLRKREINKYGFVLRNEGTGADLVESRILSPASFDARWTEGVLKVKSVDAALDTVILNRTDSGRTVTLTLQHDYVRFYKVGNSVAIHDRRFSDPINKIIRTPATVAGDPDVIRLLVSPPLEMIEKDDALKKLKLQIPAGVNLPAEFQSLNINEEILVYVGVDTPESSPGYEFAEIISKEMLTHFNSHFVPFNAKNNAEVIDTRDESNADIPSILVPSCSKRKKEIVGVYNGGARHHGNIYHPTAKCFMRTEATYDKKWNLIYGEFCAICRYTLVNIIDPVSHKELDEDYMKRKIYTGPFGHL